MLCTKITKLEMLIIENLVDLYMDYLIATTYKVIVPYFSPAVEEKANRYKIRPLLSYDVFNPCFISAFKSVTG